MRDVLQVIKIVLYGVIIVLSAMLAFGHIQEMLDKKPRGKKLFCYKKICHKSKNPLDRFKKKRGIKNMLVRY